MKTAWEPEDIFEKDLRPHCEMAIQKYCEKFQNCAFRFSSGLECIVRRPGHDKHCAENGTRIPGQFDPSEYQEDSTKTVNEIRRLFIALYKNLCARDQQVPSLPNPEIIFKQREEVFESFVSTWKLTKSNKTCFTCLQSVPDHVLPCGHGYCPVCVQEFGQKSNYFEYGLEMDHCILCQTQWRERHVQLIRLKPKCAGFRILTLDGGGVRGIMELALLDALERRIGLRLPIREFFDLIMGTSTGKSKFLPSQILELRKRLRIIACFKACRKSLSKKTLLDITSYSLRRSSPSNMSHMDEQLCLHL